MSHIGFDIEFGKLPPTKQSIKANVGTVANLPNYYMSNNLITIIFRYAQNQLFQICVWNDCYQRF